MMKKSYRDRKDTLSLEFTSYDTLENNQKKKLLQENALPDEHIRRQHIEESSHEVRAALKVLLSDSIETYEQAMAHGLITDRLPTKKEQFLFAPDFFITEYEWNLILDRCEEFSQEYIGMYAYTFGMLGTKEQNDTQVAVFKNRFAKRCVKRFHESKDPNDKYLWDKLFLITQKMVLINKQRMSEKSDFTIFYHFLYTYINTITNPAYGKDIDKKYLRRKILENMMNNYFDKYKNGFNPNNLLGKFTRNHLFIRESGVKDIYVDGRATGRQDFELLLDENTLSDIGVAMDLQDIDSFDSSEDFVRKLKDASPISHITTTKSKFQITTKEAQELQRRTKREYQENKHSSHKESPSTAHMNEKLDIQLLGHMKQLFYQDLHQQIYDHEMSKLPVGEKLQRHDPHSEDASLIQDMARMSYDHIMQSTSYHESVIIKFQNRFHNGFV